MVNADKPSRWKSDTAQSIDFYNDWFMNFAPTAFIDARQETTQQVIEAMEITNNFSKIGVPTLRNNPSILQVLRMATTPPLARDRLIGLAGASSSLVHNMESMGRISPKITASDASKELSQICKIIKKLLDKEIFSWLNTDETPTDVEIYRAATVIADRLCNAVADPIIRNAQEQRQLTAIKNWLEQHGYQFIQSNNISNFADMPRGTFTFRLNIQVVLNENKSVNIPIDTVVSSINANSDELPLLIEAKSAGDFTNTNKRRKEEAIKISQLRSTYGERIQFILFLCGFFDSSYLGYEAAEGIDWVWEHRMDDLVEFGL